MLSNNQAYIKKVGIIQDYARGTQITISRLRPFFLKILQKLARLFKNSTFGGKYKYRSIQKNFSPLPVEFWSDLDKHLFRAETLTGFQNV